MSRPLKRPRPQDAPGTPGTSSSKRPATATEGPCQPPATSPADQSHRPPDSLKDLNVKYIQRAIIQVYKQEISNLQFAALYGCSHFLIQSGQGMLLYKGITDILRALLQDWFTTRLLPAPDETFLSTLQQMWDEHYVAVQLASKLAMQLDKSHGWGISAPTTTWSPPAHVGAARAPSSSPTDPPPAVLPIIDLGIHLFGELLQQLAVERCRGLMLSVVRAERNGMAAPQRGLLKGLTDMMVVVGLDAVYVPCLEAGYLLEAETYFTREASEFFPGNSVVDYLRKVLKRIDEEEARAKCCMHSTTGPKLKALLDRILVKDYEGLIIEKEGSGVRSMLAAWRLDDLKLVYTAFRRVDHLKPLIDEVANFCKDEGMKIVGRSADHTSAVQMVEELAALRTQFTQLLNQCCSRIADDKMELDPAFVKAIHTAFKDVIKSHRRLPEYLSLFVDNLLQPGKNREHLSDEDTESVFDNVLILFDYLADKDLFELFYKQHLAKRLLNSKSSAGDHERLFLTKLKTAHGHSYTNHLEGMFRDVEQAEGVMSTYREYLGRHERKHPIELHVTVLTINHWPLSPSPAVIVPPEMNGPLQDFAAFYLRTHTNGRRLSYCLSTGHADVKFTSRGRKYELNVSTLQTIVLLLFNAADELTLDEIQQQTGIEARELRRILIPLFVGKPKMHAPILKRVKADTASESSESRELTGSTRLQVNGEFNSKLVKIKLPPAQTREAPDEGKAVITRVEDERKHIADCAIVRIMKSRRVLGHQELIAELIRQLRERFHPQPAFLKQRIEDLISREYLRRDPDHRTMYHYVA